MGGILPVRILRRACEVAGGVHQLCRRLHVPRTALEHWLEGSAEPPRQIVLRAIDLIGEADGSRSVSSKRPQAQADSDSALPHRED